ncbi:tetratricopeptide repeat protein [Pontiella sulfatireligans]|uniref:Uncharacterized protein n=1 Tax=Pontiella sulfatireligans TaxID=2750658 RepID=A0A6C2UPM7_9BACT|nr:tetratricopeptide repeat protein [Pontiella sulfatireligans]VGO22158.1 hypothetical protein SCARR_04239 [Pontiella sulfatireligans]
MKSHLLVIASLLLASSCVFSQETGSTSNAALSGLSIETQTTEERIQFLLDVATAYFNEDDFESAISAYERILEIDPMHQQTRFIIGHVYISGKQYKKAEEQLSALIEDYPEDFKLLNNLAWLYATAEDPSFRDGQKAISLARQAIVLAPNDHHVWSTLSEAYYVSSEYEKAYRSINHMAALAARYGTDITKESVEDYNEQIRKCKRAMDTAEAIKGDLEE